MFHRLTQKLASLLLLCSLLCPTALADSPLWVDGNGNFISGPDSTTSIGASGTGDGSSNTVYDPANPSKPLIVPDEEDQNACSNPEHNHAAGDTHHDHDTDSGLPQKWEYDPTALTASWQGETVTVLALGTQVSIIRQGKENIEVYTRELTFDTAAPTGKQLAIINAPKTGRCSMRKKNNNRSAIIMKCQTGRIVAVKDIKGSYAQIQYEDALGWVPKKYLTFVEASSAETATEMGYIAYKGNARSKNTVKVRQKAASGSRVLEEYPCGQRVVVLEKGDKWTQIEAENLRCYILTEYLTTLTEAESREIPLRGIAAQRRETVTYQPAN